MPREDRTQACKNGSSVRGKGCGCLLDEEDAQQETEGRAKADAGGNAREKGKARDQRHAGKRFG